MIIINKAEQKKINSTNLSRINTDKIYNTEHDFTMIIINNITLRFFFTGYKIRCLSIFVWIDLFLLYNTVHFMFLFQRQDGFFRCVVFRSARCFGFRLFWLGWSAIFFWMSWFGRAILEIFDSITSFINSLRGSGYVEKFAKRCVFGV
jgi:hypothetical protein